MQRSRTAPAVPWPAVARVIAPMLALLLLAVAACGLIRAAGVPAGATGGAAPVAMAVPGSDGLLPAHVAADDTADDRGRGGCSKAPNATEGAPSPRIESTGGGVLFVADPPDAGRVPADRDLMAGAVPARPAPLSIMLSVLRI